MNKTSSSRNKLAVTPVGKLLFTMSLPATVAMAAQAATSLVGGAFVSGDGAFKALAVAYPFEALMTAFAIGLSIGAGSAAARRLGSGSGADGVARSATLAALILSVVLTAAGIGLNGLFVNAFSLTAREADEARIYLTIVSAGITLTVFHTLYNRLSISVGSTFLPMLAAIFGGAVTIVLDLILVKGKLGIPPMSMTGLAIANVTGQAVTLAGALIAVKKAPIDPFIKRGFRPKKEEFKDIFRVGIPSVIQNGISSMFLTAMNAILAGGLGVELYGAYYKVQSLAYMPSFGLNQGSMPVMGSAYGAGDKARFDKTFKYTLFAALAITLTVFLAAQIFPAEILKLFDISDADAEEGVLAFRILSASFIPASFSLVFAAVFTSTGHGAKAMALNVLRGAALSLPMAYLMNKYSTLTAVWISLAAAEYAALIVFIPILIGTYKKLFNTNLCRLS